MRKFDTLAEAVLDLSAIVGPASQPHQTMFHPAEVELNETISKVLQLVDVLTDHQGWARREPRLPMECRQLRGNKTRLDYERGGSR